MTTTTARCSQPAAIDPVVDVLAELAGGGRALELGDRDRPDRAARWRGAASRSTASTCRGRWSRGCARSPARDAIGVTIGDIATTRVDGAFSVVYLVFNTIMNLTTQAAQVACFRNAAAHLEPGGTFVIEVGVPEPPAPAAGRAPRGVRRRPSATGGSTSTTSPTRG